jgi:hypothetical protein
MKLTLIISSLLIILPFAFLAKDYGFERMAVDSCLDSGGSYDYEIIKCDKNKNHTYTSYYQRKNELILSCIAISLLGIVVLVLTRRKIKSYNKINTADRLRSG